MVKLAQVLRGVYGEGGGLPRVFDANVEGDLATLKASVVLGEWVGKARILGAGRFGYSGKSRLTLRSSSLSLASILAFRAFTSALIPGYSGP